MPQFSLYRTKNSATRGRFPLLLDIQSDLLDPLATRVVIPLSPVAGTRARSMRTLSPVLLFGGKEYALVTPQLAGIATRELGPVVGDLTAHRAAIIAALDFLIFGM
jgi:toxin CcdB